MQKVNKGPLVESFASEGSRQKGWRRQLSQEAQAGAVCGALICPLSTYYVPGTSKGRSSISYMPLSTQVLFLQHLTGF